MTKPEIDTETDDYDTVLKTIKSFLIEPYTVAVQAAEYSNCKI